MRATLPLFLGLLAFLLSSCSKPKPTPPSNEPLTEVTPGGGDRFVDLSLTIRSHKKLHDGSFAVEAYGLHQGREIGISVVLGSKWKPSSLGSNPPLITYQGTVTYQSLGASSDSFIQMLDQLYGTKLSAAAMRQSTTFTAISLAGDPTDLAKGPTKIKLFFESDDNSRYAELYTNIDLAHDILQIHEKDSDYRAAVIRDLSSQ